MKIFIRTSVAVHRRWYLVATYTGIRAIANRLRSFFVVREVEIARFIHGAKISREELGDIVVCVHSRACPSSGDDRAIYGMISVRQQRPRVSRFLYRYTAAHHELRFPLGKSSGRRLAKGRAHRSLGQSSAAQLAIRSFGEGWSP